MDWSEAVAEIRSAFSENHGFECHPFKIGSYNALTSPPFHLPYASETLAVLVLNTPLMFENSLRPWMVEKWRTGEEKQPGLNPIDEFMVERVNQAKRDYLTASVDVMHDFEMWPNRRPKILMCTCGHAAGAARYYQLADIVDSSIIESLPLPKKVIGVSLHPVYGGHFAFRCVFVFPEIRLPDTFRESSPPHMLKTDEEILEAIHLFNLHWADGRFRDCGSPSMRYEARQLAYFSKSPAHRWEIIADWME